MTKLEMIYAIISESTISGLYEEEVIRRSKNICKDEVKLVYQEFKEYKATHTEYETETKAREMVSYILG